MVGLLVSMMRWRRREQREDIHEPSGMRDARELARHVLRAVLVNPKCISVIV
jgi:hypothetical protein